MTIPSRSSRIIVCALVPIPWIILFGQWVFLFPRFIKLFTEFGLVLSLFSQGVIAVSQLVRNNVLISAWLFVILAMISVRQAHRWMSREQTKLSRSLCLFGLFGVPLLLFAISWVGILGPYSKLMEGLNR